MEWVTLNKLLIALFVLLPSLASAQTVRADRFTFNTGPCVLRSGSGTPEGAVTGNVCDTFWRTDTGIIYSKTSGVGNTGWTTSVTGSGTTGTIPKWTGATALGDSIITESSSTVGVAGLISTTGATAGTSHGPRDGSGNTYTWYNPTGDEFRLNNGTDLITVLNNGRVGVPGFVSQTTGWSITQAGAADFRYLFTDEMHAKSFIADLEQALAGGQIITKSVGILVSLTCPAASAAATLTVEDLPGAADMQIFDTGDSIAIRTFSRAAQSLTIADCVGVVSLPDTTGSGTQSWTFTRNAAAGAGTMTGATVIPAGTIVLDYGTTGNGYYEVNAVDGLDAVNSPYAQIVTWATAPVAANRTVQSRFGKLTGITGTANEFGLLAGTYAASDGAFFRASNSAFDLHGITQKFWDGATNVITLAPNAGAPYIGIGNPAPSTCCTTAGIFLGWTSGNVAAFSAYADANNYLTYNGSVLTWKASNTSLDASGNLTATSATLSGSVTATSGMIANWSIGTAAIYKDTGVEATSSGMSTADIPFYAGAQYASRTTAPFRVTSAGALTATNATITGAITATSGAIGGWTLGSTSLTSGSGASTRGVDSGGTNPAFYAGSATPGAAPFRVTAAGALTATSATITGAITATSGAIGGCSLSSTTLTCGNTTLSSTGIHAGSGAVALTSAGITLTSGTGSTNNYKFTDGSYFQSSGGVVYIVGGGSINLELSAGDRLTWNTTSLNPGTSGNDLGASGSEKWGDLWTSGTVNFSTLAGTGTRFVCVDANGRLVAGTTTGC